MGAGGGFGGIAIASLQGLDQGRMFLLQPLQKAEAAGMAEAAADLARLTPETAAD